VLGILLPNVQADCTLPAKREAVKITYVIDGDTVALGKRRIRIMGMNAPELKSHEPFSRAAKRRLFQLLGGKRAYLVADTEKKDNYQRDLRHVFTQDGRNVSEILLQEGLAYVLVMPPNVRFASCYQKAQQQARQQSLRLWGSTPQRKSGFGVRRAKLLRIDEGKKTIWLTFSDGIKAKIGSKEHPYFQSYCLSCLKNKRVSVVGWWHKRRKGWFVRLYHPVMVWR
jgi:micrococcal nuclease